MIATAPPIITGLRPTRSDGAPAGGIVTIGTAEAMVMPSTAVPDDGPSWLPTA
ncbi:hypothetical protein ACF1BB_01165 [Streptomyces griseoluteus]|uniref:hypothetical protein n=1 Tax=Streptomyces griseoluteus TaxID=29306 RepID=UPI0036FC782A